MTTLQNFQTSVDSTIIASDNPSGAVGLAKEVGDIGIFVYSELPYSIWFKEAGVWSLHQSFTSENLVNGSSFRWSADSTHVYFQTSEPQHKIYVTGRSSNILVDGTPSDGDNSVDTIVLDADTTLRILGSSDTTTTTATTHVISDAAPVTIETSNEGTIQVIEDTSDYADSLSSKLAAYYSFDDETSSDLTIGENHGTPSVDCTYVDGKSGLGKAIHQTTADAHVSLNNADLMNLGPDFTVSAWIYIPSVQSATDAVDNPYNDIAIFTNIDSYGDWTYLDGFILAVPKPGYAGGWGLPSNCLALYSGIGQGNGIYSWAYYAVASPQDSFPFDEWVHVALTFSGSDQANWGGNEKLFINGQLQSLTPRTNQPAQNAMEWTSDPLNVLLGASLRTSHPKPLAGSGELMYDEIAIWKRELSESEISDLYNEGNGVQLNTTYVESEAIREDFTITTTIAVEAPEGTEETNIKVRITK